MAIDAFVVADVLVVLVAIVVGATAAADSELAESLPPS